MATAEQYRQALQSLLPPGPAFTREPNALLTKLLDALAQELYRADLRAAQLIDEAFPDTTTELLPDWERVAGLPDACGEIAGTIQERRRDLLAKLTARGGQSRQYFIDLAAQLGFTITISEFRPFRVGMNAVGEPLYGADWWFVWQVNASETTYTYFRTGASSIGEPLRTWGNHRLECVVDQLKPAHTIVIFSYS